MFDDTIAPDSLAYGIAKATIFVVEPNGVVRTKFSGEDYSERRTAASMLVLAGGTPQGRAAEVKAPHVSARLAASNVEVTAGQRVTLVMDVEIESGWHAYAPGAKEYRALALRLDPQPLLRRVHEPTYPASRPFYFAPLQETVPVFEGSVRVLQDVTVGDWDAFNKLVKNGPHELVLQGALEYQVCSEELCQPPSKLPVRVALQVQPFDLVRAPTSAQHKASKASR